MAIFKRGKTWWIDFTTPGGDRIRRSAQTKDRAKAQELYDYLKNESWRVSKLKERPTYTWDQAVVKWVEEKKHLATMNDVMSRLRWLQQFLRGRRLDMIDRNLIDEIARQRQKDVSRTRTNRYLELIGSILNRAVVWDWIERAPDVQSFPEPKRRIRWLTKEEAKRLLALLPPHQADIAQFALLTGLRQRNILELAWMQINLDRRVAWIHPDQAKARKAIGVPLSEEAMEIIRRQIGKHDRFVFSYKGKPVGQINTKGWRAALKKAEIQDFRWHDLRHTWASWHIQAGTPLNVLQELGGWESFEMVRRYAHLASDHLAPYVEKVLLGTNTAHRELRLVQ